MILIKYQKPYYSTILILQLAFLNPDTGLDSPAQHVSFRCRSNTCRVSAVWHTDCTETSHNNLPNYMSSRMTLQLSLLSTLEELSQLVYVGFYEPCET